MDDDECGAVGGTLHTENRSTQRKPATVALCLPQIPHDLTWARTRAAAMGSRRLTARAKERLNDRVYSTSLSVCMRRMRTESQYILSLFQQRLEAVAQTSNAISQNRHDTILMRPEKNLLNILSRRQELSRSICLCVSHDIQQPCSRYLSCSQPRGMSSQNTRNLSLAYLHAVQAQPHLGCGHAG
jgi:hypothetical protein